MTKIFKPLAIALSLIFMHPAFSLAASHTVWKVVPEASTVYFGSIKKNKIGEVHSFSDVTGTVDSKGKVDISINLASVNTGIPIRDRRILRHVLDKTMPAKLTAQLDMASLNVLPPSELATVQVEGNLELGGMKVPISAGFLVVRLAENRVLVTTQSMIMLSTAKAGLDPGIDKLAELAKLKSITRVSPVTIHLMLVK